jgi:4'-phosphopantetheinyl transferase
MLGKWNPVDALPPLEENELQLWRIEVDDAIGILPAYYSLLSPEESDRASRRRKGQLRDQFVLARACLRILLGHRLLVTPHQVPIYENSYGKPETPVMNGRGISYSVAHSQGTILIALCCEGAVGVDIEHLDRVTDIMEIAQMSFTPTEIMKLAALEEPCDRSLAFYRCWTQKEAVIKADGRGVSLSLSAFEVPIHSAQSSPVLLSESSEDPGKLYFVSEIPLGSKDAVGAVALDSVNYRINMLNFPVRSV